MAIFAAGCSTPPTPPRGEAPPAPSAASSRPEPVASATVPSAAPSGSSAAPSPAPFRSTETVDVVIRGGEVIDGTGAPRRRADVVVRGDVVIWVGDVDPSVKARLELDATGAVVTPGFVDAHSHGDGRDDNAIAQGVTTVIVGQDGGSPTTGRFDAWLHGVDRHVRTNVGALVGHATIRARAKVGAKPSRRDYDEMRRLVDEALDGGALGLSTGLEYEPGRRADGEELAAIAEPVGRRGGIVMSHVRSEDAGAIVASLDELERQCRASKARMHVSHIKVVGGHGEAEARALLAKLDGFEKSGVRVTADWYPYTASYTGLEILFPDWARGVGTAPANRRDELRRHLRDRVLSRNGPEAMLFGAGSGHEGKTLAEVARTKGVPFEDVLVDMGPHKGNAAYFVMDEALQDRLFADPRVMVGSDGFGGSRHPRGSGSFARVVETYVAKKHVLSLEEAVRRMTSLPLDTLGVGASRGRIAPDQIADVAIFDPRQIRERATFANPTLRAAGMRHVLVSGQPVWRDGRPTDGTPGRAIHAAWTAPVVGEPVGVDAPDGPGRRARKPRQ